MKRILLLLFIICIVSCNNKKELDSKKNYQMLELKYKQEELKKQLLKDAIIRSIDLSNLKIPESSSFINCSGDTVLFKNFLSDKKVLILYTGTSFCSSCFHEELLTLNNFASKLKQRKILVLVQNINVRELIIEQERNKYKFDLGIINNGSKFEPTIFKNDEPIYFTVDNEMRLMEIFVPFKNMKKFSERYFRSIRKKW